MYTFIFIASCLIISWLLSFFINSKKDITWEKRKKTLSIISNTVLVVLILGIFLINIDMDEDELKKVQSEEIVVDKIFEDNKDVQIVTNESIDKQFSSWNGAHIKLQDLIKENMNDPDSYEHIETKYKNLGDVLEVVTKYRGTNSFGAKVIQITTAKCDLVTGDVLTID